MGGIIQTGRHYASTAAQSLKEYKRNQQHFMQLADRAKQAMSQTQQAHALQTGYLFRSAVEKNRLLQEAAREENSQLQNNLAHAGIDGSSVSAQLLLEKNKLAAQKAQEKITQEVASKISEENTKTAQALEALRAQQGQARAKANRKSTIWKITKQLFSLFK